MAASSEGATREDGASFRSQLLAIDDRLGEIQLGMLHGASPKTHDELVKILGVLTDAVQELGWYANDLEDIADMEADLPGMRPGAQQHFDRHRRRVAQMQENTRNIASRPRMLSATTPNSSPAGRQRSSTC